MVVLHHTCSLLYTIQRERDGDGGREIEIEILVLELVGGSVICRRERDYREGPLGSGRPVNTEM